MRRGEMFELGNFAVLSKALPNVISYLDLAPLLVSFVQNSHQDDVCAGLGPISSTTCVFLACLTV